MNEALAIEELVSRIVAYADVKTAVACARVCRLWSAPALDKAWAEIDPDVVGPQLVHLFRLMPEVCSLDGEESDVSDSEESDVSDSEESDVSDGDESDASDVDSEASQPIVKPSWDRFAQYARRVQVLTLTDVGIVYSDANIARIAACPLPDPLFPRLRVLHTRVRLDVESYAVLRTHILKFFSASVRGVAFSVMTLRDSNNEFAVERSGRLNDFFGEIVRRVPEVQEVMVRREFLGSLKATEAESGILTLLTGLGSLTTLAIECALLAERVLEGVLRHDALTSLHIFAEFVEGAHLQQIVLRLQDYAEQNADTSPHPPIFPSLTRLVLDLSVHQFTQFLDAAIPFLKAHTPLHTICTNLGGVTRRSDLDDALRTIAQLTTLRSVTIRQHSRTRILFAGDALALREPILVGESLKHIHALRELTEFHLLHAYPNEMEDGDVLELVRACPALQTLRILPCFGVDFEGESPSRFTLGLLALLSTQPNSLRTLQYQLHPDELSEKATEGRTSRPLPPLDSVGPHLLRAKDSGGFVDVEFDDIPYDVGFVERVTEDHRRVYIYLKQCLGEEGAGRAFASMRRFQKT